MHKTSFLVNTFLVVLLLVFLQVLGIIRYTHYFSFILYWTYRIWEMEKLHTLNHIIVYFLVLITNKL